ncbi:hypothetical protein AgCh_017463 [Apium graveolens]
MEPEKSKENMVGLTYPMLTGGNYTVWALNMKACMQAHGIWEAVTPKDPIATVEEKKDNMALDGAERVKKARAQTLKSDFEAMSMNEGHDERLGGKNKSTKGTGQLLRTEEEWRKKDKEESKLLLTKEE